MIGSVGFDGISRAGSAPTNCVEPANEWWARQDSNLSGGVAAHLRASQAVFFFLTQIASAFAACFSLFCQDVIRMLSRDLSFARHPNEAKEVGLAFGFQKNDPFGLCGICLIAVP